MPELIASVDGDFVDLEFAFERDARSRQVIARARIGQCAVGFALELGDSWREWNAPNAALKPIGGSVTLSSIGSESDSLLALLRQFYGLPPSGAKMSIATVCEAVALQGDPSRFRDGVKPKLFFNSNTTDTNQYAEVYLNIDEASQSLQLNEKDPEYRNALVRALTRN